MSIVIDKADQYPGGDTFTLEEYRRIHGLPVRQDCIECGKKLTGTQMKRRGRFCSQRCAGMWNSRQPAKPKPAPAAGPASGAGEAGAADETPTSQPEGRDHSAPTATPGETTVAKAEAAAAAEKRVPETAGATTGEGPLRAAHLPIDPDDEACVPIAAALVELLLASPDVRFVEVWCGPIGPIQVRR